MTPDPHRALIDRYLIAYNALDVPGMLAVLDPRIEFENVSQGAVTARASGLAEFRALAERAAAMFQRRQQRITSYEADAESATVGIDYEGVLAATLPPGLPPTLQPGGVVRLRGKSTFRFRAGRIARIVDES